MHPLVFAPTYAYGANYPKHLPLFPSSATPLQGNGGLLTSLCPDLKMTVRLGG